MATGLDYFLMDCIFGSFLSGLFSQGEGLSCLCTVTEVNSRGGRERTW